MRRACSVDDEVLAERACDHLLTLGIDAEVRESEAAYDVWVHDDRHMEQARRELDRFLAAPDGEEFRDVDKRARQVRAAREEQLSGQRSRTIDVRTERHRRLMEAPLFTTALIAVTVGIGVITKLGGEWYPFVDRLAFSGADLLESGARMFHGWNDILAGQIWRLVTPILIHFGAMHLVFNMVWLRNLGGDLETEYGWERLLGLIAAIAIPSNVAQFMWSGPRFGGMSGVVYGLFGYIWARSRNEPGCKVDVDDGTVKVMMLWLVLCMTGWLGPIANTAHVVGLVAGGLLGGGSAVARRWLRRLGR